MNKTCNLVIKRSVGEVTTLVTKEGITIDLTVIKVTNTGKIRLAIQAPESVICVRRAERHRFCIQIKRSSRSVGVRFCARVRRTK